MKYKDVSKDDPRWSESDRLVFEHLFRQVDRYTEGHRPLETHGVKRAILTMAQVLVALGAENDDESID
jgi:hypothetical protein